TQLAFSPDGRRLAAARWFRTTDGVDLNAVVVWDVATGQLAQTFERAHAFAFSADGRLLAAATQRSCTMFEVDGWKRLRSLKPLAGALALGFSARDERLTGVVSAADGCKLVCCDAQSGEERAQSLAFEEPFYNFSGSPDGKLVATGHDGGDVLLWNAETLEPTKRFAAGGQDRQRAIFSPDGKVLACCGQAQADVVFFDVASGRELSRMHFDDGKFTTLLRRRAEEKLRPESDPARFAISPDGALFLAGPGGGVLRRIDTGAVVRRLTD
ncbi:MAG: hypothetical protein KDA41_18230, partial [Planctomycetales bacterium]|nr:hypothetical protein [Planctomycetales bacterium]